MAVIRRSFVCVEEYGGPQRTEGESSVTFSVCVDEYGVRGLKERVQ